MFLENLHLFRIFYIPGDMEGASHVFSSFLMALIVHYTKGASL